MGVDGFLVEVLATVVGGVALAFLLFLAKEKIFPLPAITGRWFYQMTTHSTTYAPYEGMVLRYVAVLWREGCRIEGTVEKIYEKSATGEREFVGKNRTRGVASGYIEKNYLGKDRIFLHIVEEGHGRESTTLHQLSPRRGGLLKGTFTSMVAEQHGPVQWQRRHFTNPLAVSTDP